MPTKKQYLWKFLNDGMKSSYGDCTWKIGEWKKEVAAVRCNQGFHGSKRIIDAFSYVKGSILAKVEVKGKCDKEYDKEAWTEMRIVKAYKWTKEESVRLAIFSAELVIGIYEKEYPNDYRPRKAIEAAKEYLKNPGKVAADAAADAAARAAYAADAAAYAADAAARAAADAADAADAYAADAYAADAAADAAARAAAYAAYAADAAARAAAYATADAADAKKVLTKIEKYLLSRIKKLEEIK